MYDFLTRDNKPDVNVPLYLSGFIVFIGLMAGKTYELTFRWTLVIFTLLVIDEIFKKIHRDGIKKVLKTGATWIFVLLILGCMFLGLGWIMNSLSSSKS